MGLRIKEVFEKIKKSVRYDEVREDGNDLSLILDRYRRHDHGGGEDGDDWLDNHEIENDYCKGSEKYRETLNKVNRILVESGFDSCAYFELGEKGHFSIEINL